MIRGIGGGVGGGGGAAGRITDGVPYPLGCAAGDAYVGSGTWPTGVGENDGIAGIGGGACRGGGGATGATGGSRMSDSAGLGADTVHPVAVDGFRGMGGGGGGGGGGGAVFCPPSPAAAERSLSLRARADFCCWRFRRREDGASG